MVSLDSHTHSLTLANLTQPSPIPHKPILHNTSPSPTLNPILLILTVFTCHSTPTLVCHKPCTFTLTIQLHLFSMPSRLRTIQLFNIPSHLQCEWHAWQSTVCSINQLFWLLV